MTGTVDLQFSDFLGKFRQFGKSEWITVYENNRNSSEWNSFYCAFISNERIEKSLSDPSWDNESIKPLVTQRSLYGMKNGYLEISEEFRHYFNLKEDGKMKTVLKITKRETNKYA